nr:hypothetical protein [uncultured Acidovorax sp.]
MINLKSLEKLARPSNVPAAARCIVFDGQTAVAVANAIEAAPWWAGVPHAQAGVSRPVPVPMEALKAHQLRSRHLLVDDAGLHNGAGLRTEWPADHACAGAAALLPAMPAGEPVVQCEIDLDALDRVAIAAAVSDIRYYLQGVLLDFDAGALVGTDGARLHCHRGGVPVVAGAGQVIVPVDAVKWLLHSADEVAQVTVWRMDSGRGQVLLRTSDAFVFAHGLEGRYPEWQRVVPALDACGARFRADPSAFAAAVESMGKLHRLESGGRWGVVSLDVVAGRVHAGGGDSFHAVDMTADTAHGEAFPLYLTADYLQDAADCVGVGARWAMPKPGKAGPAGPLLVVDGSFTAVVMPHRPPQVADKPETQAAQVPPPADPEEAPKAEPCPAAVTAMAAQLEGRASAGAEAPQKARKGRASRKAEAVEA